MVRLSAAIAVLLLAATCQAAETALEGGSTCCSPDLIFLVDITDNIGFSKSNCESHIREFMQTIYARATVKNCNEVRIAIAEYGKTTRIKFDFNKYQSNDAVKAYLAKYSSGSSIGDISNAKAAFDAAKMLITNSTRGHRASSTVFIYWLVHSTPDVSILNMLQNVVAQIKNKLAYIVVVAVDKGVDQSIVKPLATSSSYYFYAADILKLVSKCDDIRLDYCPRTTTAPPSTTQPAPTEPKTTTTTTTTTTTKPTTTTTKKHYTTKTTTPQPDPENPTDATAFCFGCRSRRNHKDLYADPANCHNYIQCFYFNETYAVGIPRVCPPGTFWHDAILQCMPEDPARPCIDPCMDDATAAQGCYAGTGCRQYFVCANTASYGMCCPRGTAFSLADNCGCVESETCNDACAQQGPATQTTVLPPNSYNSTVCKDSWGTYISAVAGESNAFYLIDQEGNPTVKQYCPPATSFDRDLCACNDDASATLPDPIAYRRALLWLPFDVDTNDYSIYRWSTFLYDGADRDASISAVGGGSLQVQNGRLEVPGFKTYDFRQAGSWCAFFRCGASGQCTGGAGILSNNKDASSTSYTAIVALQSANSITGRLSYWHPVGAQSVNSNTLATGWNHVCVTYDGAAIRLYLNGANPDTEFVSGYLSIGNCPFVVGDDQQYGPFNGYIDDVLVTPFAMTQDEVKAHQTGDRAYLQARGFF